MTVKANVNGVDKVYDIQKKKWEVQELCPICKQDNWHSLDRVDVPCGRCQDKKDLITCPQCADKKVFPFQLRQKEKWFVQGVLYKEEIGFQVCKTCGYVTYARRWNDEYYKDNIVKLFTENINSRKISLERRKAMQIGEFILSAIEAYEIKRDEKNKTKIRNILDYGCSLGYNRKIFSPETKFVGLEINENYSKYANKINDVNIISDISRDIKYELIIMNHSLDHSLNPSQLLSVLRQHLDGYLYVGVPIYLSDLHDMNGYGTRDFESVYSINHNICFTETSLTNLLNVSGFEIIAKKYDMNGIKVLCRKSENISDKYVSEDYNEIQKKLVLQYQAIAYFIEGMKAAQAIATRDEAIKLFVRSIESYPHYLDAWLALSTQKVNYENIDRLHKIFVDADKMIRFKERLYMHFANIFKDRGEPGKITSWINFSKELYEKVLQVNPHNADAWAGLFYLEVTIIRNEEKILELKDRILKLAPELWTIIHDLVAIYYQSHGQINN